jgi:potassium-transporting ATPase potassium-binding subunit
MRHTTKEIGNFWVDMTRSTLYILLPLSLVVGFSAGFAGRGANFQPVSTVALIQSSAGNEAQVIAVGPAASQVAIKQLGTNGGGFFNVNSSHPLENPTPFSNFLEMLSILLIPAALCYTFGKMVGDTRQGWALLAVMTIIFVVVERGSVVRAKWQPCFYKMGIDQTQSRSTLAATWKARKCALAL